MRIVVIGSTGVIGKAVTRALWERHEVIGVSRSSHPAVDITEYASIARLFTTITNIDGVVSCAGNAAWKPLLQLTDDDFEMSLHDKLMGQVNVVRQALQRINDRGSITVTSGVLAGRPMHGSGAVSLVNAGLEGFIRSAALEAPRDIRVNIVSPPWVRETLIQLGMDPAAGLAAETVAKAYVAAVEGIHHGETIHATQFA
ncbi:MAG: aklaviketone reductase [Myxococcales bacterium]|nr:aklaviketone reductase [Myxococcales bacterium]